MTTGSLAYWALIEHHRLWFANDGPNFVEVQINGRLTLEVSSRIALEYNVARNIGAVADASGAAIPGLESLIDEINQSSWPESLSQRAKICIDIAQDHQKRGRKIEAKGNPKRKVHCPISGVTKLMWFLRPEGWTMFDRLARIGLIDQNNDPLSFYRALEENSFSKKAADITQLCRDKGFQLYGERVIDKLLLFRGQKASDKSGGAGYNQTMNHNYLSLLPDDQRRELQALADMVSDMLPDQTFKQRPSPRRTRKA